MSQFYTLDFIFDDIPSQKFDLKIISFEDGGLFNGVGSSDVEILTQSVLRKSKPYYLGRTQPTVLQFPLTFGTHKPIGGMDRDMISAWLFGRSTYKKLYILQDDLNGAYFNCFLTQPEPLYIGGFNYAFTCQVVCDSPWAYGPTNNFHMLSQYHDDYGFVWDNYSIYNKSSEDEYVYPILNIGITGDIPWRRPSIYFENEEGIETSFTDLPPLTDFLGQRISITVDNDLQMITSNVSNIISYFNLKWFRLVPKKNNIKTRMSYWAWGSVGVVWNDRLKIGG